MSEGIAVLYRVCRAGIQVMAGLSGLRVTGQNQVPSQGPCIIVCNHISNADPPIVGASVRHRQVHFMAKRELFQVPGLGRLLVGLGSFPVDRGRSDRRALERAIELLGQGRVVGLFPEGTRSPDGQPQPFHIGAALIAGRSGAPVVPAAVVNTRLHLEERRWRLHPPPMRIRFGQALHFDRGSGPSRGALSAFLRQLEARVDDLRRECEEDSHGFEA